MRIDEHPGQGGPDLAALAALLADGTRAEFCIALLDGRAWTASELARHAGVAPSTATEHLNTLVAGGLLTQHRQGRHRYVQLADPEVAEIVEMLSARAPQRHARPRSLKAVTTNRALANARTCYDHLAGTLGVALADALSGHGYLHAEQAMTLTASGQAWLAGLGIVLDRDRRRPVARPCLDWTERRPHVAGMVGAALCAHALDRKWIVRLGSSRAVAVTPLGERALRDHLGLDLAATTGHLSSAAR